MDAKTTGKQSCYLAYKWSTCNLLAQLQKCCPRGGRKLKIERNSNLQGDSISHNIVRDGSEIVHKQKGVHGLI